MHHGERKEDDHVGAGGSEYGDGRFACAEAGGFLWVAGFFEALDDGFQDDDGIGDEDADGRWCLAW